MGLVAMCSFVLASFLLANATLEAANRIQRLRGPDATTHVRVGGFDIVHNLLSMTGDLVMQPFRDPVAGHAAVFNGEIYNADVLLTSSNAAVPFVRSDGEVLLPAYQRFGATRMFQMLDGEWAAVVIDWSEGLLTLSRDCFGTKPLYYAVSEDSSRFAAASYRSALLGIGFRRAETKTVPPNSILHLRFSVTTASGTASAFKARGPGHTVCEFDLRQWKTSTAEWRAAFLASVAKRAHGQRVFIGLSSGYDSGALQLALHQLSIAPFDSFTIAALEDLDIVHRRQDRAPGPPGSRAAVVHLGLNDLYREARWVAEHVEPAQYVTPALRGGDIFSDPASVGLSYIARLAKEAMAGGTAAQLRFPVFLSAAGADETLCDYGFNGTALAEHSAFRGIWPTDLGPVFPWPSLHLGTQRDYLAKEEHVCGAHGLEARYPFLDRRVVQEFLWLRSDVKGKEYKRPLADFFRKAQTTAGSGYGAVAPFPYKPGEKKPFAGNAGVLARDAEGRAGAPSREEWRPGGRPRPAGGGAGGPGAGGPGGLPGRGLPGRGLAGAGAAGHGATVASCTAEVAARLQVWTVSDAESYANIYGSEYYLCDLAESARIAGFGRLHVAGLGQVFSEAYWRRLQQRHRHILGFDSIPVKARSTAARSMLDRYPLLRWLVLLEGLEPLSDDVPVLVTDPLDVLFVGAPEAAAAAYCQLQPAASRPTVVEQEQVVLAAESACYPFAPETAVGDGRDSGFYGEGKLFWFGAGAVHGVGNKQSVGRPVHARRVCGEFRRSISSRAFPNAGGLMGRAGQLRLLLQEMLGWVERLEPGQQPWAQPLLYLAMLDRAISAGRGRHGTGAIVDADARLFASLHSEADGGADAGVGLQAKALVGPCACNGEPSPRAGVWPPVLHFNGNGKRILSKCARCLLGPATGPGQAPRHGGTDAAAPTVNEGSSRLMRLARGCYVFQEEGRHERPKTSADHFRKS